MQTYLAKKLLTGKQETRMRDELTRHRQICYLNSSAYTILQWTYAVYIRIVVLRRLLCRVA